MRPVAVLAILSLTVSTLASAASHQDPLFLSDARYSEQMQTLVVPLMQHAESGFFEGEDGIDIAYTKLEHPNPKGKIAVVAGYSETFFKYRELSYTFYKSGYSVYFYEQRGMGRSGRMTKDPQMVYVKKFSDYTDDLKTFLTAIVPQDSKPLMIFAHSLGGGIVSDFLVHNPNFPVSAVVLNAPMLGIQTGKYPKAVALSIAAGATLVGQGQKYAPGEGPIDYSKWVVETAHTSSGERFLANADFVRTENVGVGGTSFGWIKEVLMMSYRNSHKWAVHKVSTPILMSQAGIETLVDKNDMKKFCDHVKNCTFVPFPEARHEVYNEVEKYRVPWLTKAIAHFDAHVKK